MSRVLVGAELSSEVLCQGEMSMKDCHMTLYFILSILPSSLSSCLPPSSFLPCPLCPFSFSPSRLSYFYLSSLLFLSPSPTPSPTPLLSLVSCFIFQVYDMSAGNGNDVCMSFVLLLGSPVNPFPVFSCRIIEKLDLAADNCFVLSFILAAFVHPFLVLICSSPSHEI